MIVRLLQAFMAGVILVVACGAQAQGETPKPWYIALGAGGAWYEDVKFGGLGTASMDTGFTVNGAFGRYIDDIRVFRLEAEVLYDRADVDNVSGTPASGTLSNAGLMFNAIYDIRTNTSWVPYFGGGIGYSRVDMDSLSVGGVTVVNDSDDVFSWQIKAGVAYEFNPSWAVNLGYRYYATDNLVFAGPGGPVTSEGTTTHSAELGVRFNF